MTVIFLFLILHWYLSLFGQTFFLHRYAAHKMFTMSKAWEKFWYVYTWVMQGSSYLNARAYAILHRMHHAYSDTEKDVHSPVIHNFFEAHVGWFMRKSNACFVPDPQVPDLMQYPELVFLNRHQKIPAFVLLGLLGVF